MDIVRPTRIHARVRDGQPEGTRAGRACLNMLCQHVAYSNGCASLTATGSLCGCSPQAPDTVGILQYIPIQFEILTN